MVNFDRLGYQMRLQQLDWSVLYIIEDINLKWDMVKKAIMYDANHYCPLKWFKVKKNIPEWHNGEIMRVAQDRDRLFRNYRRNKKENPSLYQQAVSKRREFNKLVKSVKTNYVTEQLSLYKNNQVKFWKVISRLSGSKVARVIDQVCL